MPKVTKRDPKAIAAGERLRECRTDAHLSQEELSNKVYEHPDNGFKKRSPKQIGYIERGERMASPEYAALLAKVLGVNMRYLTLEEDFKTDGERISAIVGKQYERRDLISSLIALHGYIAEDVTSSQPIQKAEDGREYQKPVLSITSPKGAVRFLSPKDFDDLLKTIDDYIEMQLLFRFRQLTDGAKEYWG